MTERIPVGFTGKLWKKATTEDLVKIKQLALEGYSMREIGRQIGRTHRFVSYHLLPEEIKELMRNEQRKKRIVASLHPQPRVSILHKKLVLAVLQARSRAEKQGWEINITVKDLQFLYDKQEGKCALTGTSFSFDKNNNWRTQPFVPSIDRIDSKKGYTKDNVRLVIWALNWSFGEWGEKVYEKIAKAYLEKKQMDNVRF